MTTILKRTTAIAAAIAALAVLPLAPIAVHAQSQTDQAAGQTETMPEAQSATPSTGAERAAEDSAGDASDSAGVTAPETDDATQSGAGDAATTGGESTEQADGTDADKAGEQKQAEDAGQDAADQPQQAEGAGPDQPAAGQQAEGAAPGQPADQEQAATGDGSDPIVARVGDADITQSDVLGVIGALPPELQQQPAEMLIPLALEQLVLRELILDKAREAGLDSDPDVDALLSGAGDASEESRENAMVQVWLDRELEGAVTDSAVQETYGQIQDEFGERVPPIEQIRPQIEEELRRLAFLELSEELQTGADVTLFGPDGQPIAE